MSAKQEAPQLAIDIGNTVVKAAVFSGGERIAPVLRFTDQEWSVADRLVTNHGVKNIIYSTVANVLPAKWKDKWEAEGRFLLALGPAVPLPFRSAYGTMDTLGQDRIAAVAGSLTISAPAAAPLPGLVVDAGTCATLDLIDGEGTYLGGNISPGVRMRLQAMHTFTARLPALAPAPVSGAVGQSTAAALRHGAQMGLVYEIEGLYRRLRADFPQLRLLLTGGDGAWLSDQLTTPHVFCPNLVLRGLHLILSNYVANES